jgi:hypothetical protein
VAPGMASSFTSQGFADWTSPDLALKPGPYQDPRYFYQGTGATKSRVLHAVSFPFICRRDNGRLQPNYSTIGGNLCCHRECLLSTVESRSRTFLGTS